MSDALPFNECLQEVVVKGRYKPTDDPRDTFLLPMLARAARYDRAAGYFSSTSLAAAADGLEPFITRGGRIRLVVNHQLADADVAAVERGLELRETAASALAKISMAADSGSDEPARLRLLATLVALRQLDIKVAVAAHPDGRPLRPDEVDRIHHAKFGTFYDRCKPPCAVAFEGSNNETHSGWLANYETYNAFVSWDEADWDKHGRPLAQDFDDHWDPDSDVRGWAILELPEAAREGLLANADPELARKALTEQGREDEIDEVVGRILAARGELAPPPDAGDLADLLSAPQQTVGVGLATATVQYWPHQSDVARKVVSAWPCSRMFSDEVGLGKTIEVGAVVRELLVSGKVDRALLLVPASVIWQWQAELWEKFNLAIPVLDGRKLVWRDVPGPTDPDVAGDKVAPVTGNRWDAADVMLASSHLARRSTERQHLIDRSWDLVVVDEAHHARRRGSKPTKDDPNALLQLLRRMRDAGSWSGVLLASATPMQMHPHEAHDLLDVLGLPGPSPDFPDDRAWSTGGAVGFNHYYEQLVKEDPQARDWPHLRSYARSHAAAFPDKNPHLVHSIERAAGQQEISKGASRKISRFADAVSDKAYRRFSSSELAWLDAWLREHTPMRALVHRNTRHLLRQYKTAGIIGEDVDIPRREVRDLRVAFDEYQPNSTQEQDLYDRIEDWIRDKYAQVSDAAAKGDRRAKATGFIMTVYRRRLTSSFRAIELSLRKRREVLAQHADGLFNLASLLEDDDRTAIDDIDDDLLGLLDVEDGDDPALNVSEAASSTASEIDELDDFLRALEERTSYDSKLQKLVDDLRVQMGHSKPDGQPRQAIIFTQFTDTMDALREQLAAIWPGQVGCYSGRGGEVHDPSGQTWVKVDKGTIKAAFRAGEYRILVGTDAMSEGLNLQTCDLLYNLDLPWNFMRIEQRIGRIDRIGGHPTVHVVNLLVEGTVEERIYSGIRGDFADFEHVVGAAQPVLAQTEDAIREAAMAVGPDRDEMLRQQAQALIDAAADSQAAAVNLDTFEQGTNAFAPASPLDGETCDGQPWLTVLEERLIGHSFLGQRFTDRGDGSYDYEDEYGRRWVVTFDRDVADASGGRLALFVWGHPAFPRTAGAAAGSTAVAGTDSQPHDVLFEDGLLATE